MVAPQRIQVWTRRKTNGPGEILSLSTIRQSPMSESALRYYLYSEASYGEETTQESKAQT